MLRMALAYSHCPFSMDGLFLQG